MEPQTTTEDNTPRASILSHQLISCSIITLRFLLLNQQLPYFKLTLKCETIYTYIHTDGEIRWNGIAIAHPYIHNEGVYDIFCFGGRCYIIINVTNLLKFAW